MGDGSSAKYGAVHQDRYVYGSAKSKQHFSPGELGAQETRAIIKKMSLANE